MKQLIVLIVRHCRVERVVQYTSLLRVVYVKSASGARDSVCGAALDVLCWNVGVTSGSYLDQCVWVRSVPCEAIHFCT
jgi:hypothetical protein